jgi:hypothetical protein
MHTHPLDLAIKATIASETKRVQDEGRHTVTYKIQKKGDLRTAKIVFRALKESGQPTTWTKTIKLPPK